MAPGPPAGEVRLHCRIRPDLKMALDKLANDVGCSMTRIVIESVVYTLKRAKRWPPRPSDEGLERINRQAKTRQRSSKDIIRDLSKPVIRPTAPGAKVGSRAKAGRPVAGDKGGKPIGSGRKGRAGSTR